MVRPIIVRQHPITTMMFKDSIKGATHSFAIGMILSISMLVLSYLWIIASVYTFIVCTTISALGYYLFIAIISIVKLPFDLTIVWWFLKCYDYKQFNIILTIVGNLFGCLLWFIFDVYNLNPLVHLFGYELKSSGLDALLTASQGFVIIIWCVIVKKAQENDIDQDSFGYTLMMV
jgi:hypothetical protein